MPPEVSQTLKLFPVDVTSSTLVEQVQPPRRWEHRTGLPGGFKRLLLNLTMSRADYWEWRLNRMLYRLLVEDSTATVIWEGRLEGIRVTSWGDQQVAAEMLFRGYWSNFTDTIDFTDHSAAGETILSNILSTTMHADTRQLSTDTTEQTASMDSLQLNRDDLNRTAWDTLTDADGLISHDDTSGNRVDIYVYHEKDTSGNPLVHLKARNPTALDWLAFVSTGVIDFPDEVSWRDIYNAVVGQYDSGGTPTYTGESTDANSIAKYIRREGVAGSTNLNNSATATAARDLLLAEAATQRQRMTHLRINRVVSSPGGPKPLCHVRAGDVIRVPDALTISADAGSVNLNALTTFFITETRCKHNGNTAELELTVDTTRRSLADILKKNKIRP